MGYAKVYGAQTHLLESSTIHIEADISKGLHSFVIVGLPDKAVGESKDRVSAAIKNSGFKSPKQHNCKVVISLAPAYIKKEGPLFDIGIAIAYLLAAGEIHFDVSDGVFIGELALDGQIRPVKGVLPIVLHAKKSGFKKIFVPAENILEISFIDRIDIYPISSLSEIILHAKGERLIEKYIPKNFLPEPIDKSNEMIDVNISDIKGQNFAKRALEIAALGKHNLLLYGPPGSGKTMLARAFRHLLGDLTKEEMIEVTSIYSINDVIEKPITRPPFRSPHHSSSAVAIFGGGNMMRAGEITLAHKGVLFLDEFPEFNKSVIECLREPLEEKYISIARANGTVKFPADIILVAAMNPCPCGFYGDKKTKNLCTCSGYDISRYKRKISGPITDRIDMWVKVPRLDKVDLEKDKAGPQNKINQTTENIQEKIKRAKIFQKNRIDLPMTPDIKRLISKHVEESNMSGRGYSKLLKIIRTIADLDLSNEIKTKHVIEALNYRPEKME